MPSIAIVGVGPTAIYTLAALRASPVPLEITLFEAMSEAGRGTPYTPKLNSAVMLANIASIEIPPLDQTLVGWMSGLSVEELDRLGIGSHQLDDRAFYPRVVLGEYFLTRFKGVLSQLRAAGHSVIVKTSHRVVDAELTAHKVHLIVETPALTRQTFTFDKVVLATGHSWPDTVEPKPGYFTSPWPATALGRIRDCPVGIRGTSLSAIDAAVCVASNHGAFLYDETGTLRYHAGDDAEALHITLMSRKGLLPEADFFHPIPYQPLSICTEEAVDHLIKASRPDLLDAVFGLFAEELGASDPEYAARIQLPTLSVETFAEAYFAERSRHDPFTWAARNLAEAKANQESERTIAWRYAILRMHETVALAAPHFTAPDLERFHRHFKAIFVDDYATVPHQSIERLLALRLAGKLDVIKLGIDYELDTEEVDVGATIKLEDGTALHFPAFIEAMGQESMSAQDFPFPGLLRQGAVRKAAGGRGIVLDDAYRLKFPMMLCREIYCLALPFLLHRHPFSQGITSSHELGTAVGQAILETIRLESAA